MNKILLGCFLLTVFFLNFLPVKDTDFGWHYRCGHEFLTQGKLCTSNTFTYYLKDYKAYNPSFLYDITVAAIYNSFGLIGVSFLGALVMTIGAYIFTRIIHAPLWTKIASFYTILFLSQVVFNLGFRSQITTYIFFLLTLFFIEKIREGNTKYFYFFPLLMLVWVNTHIGFFTGLIVLGFSGLDQLLRKQNVKKLLVTGILSFAATCINPFGFNVYQEVFHHSTTKLNTMIAEWLQPEIFHIVLVSVGLTMILYVAMKDKPFSLYKLLLTVFFAGLAFTARRNLPLFYTIFFYISLNSESIKKLGHKILNNEYVEDIALPLIIVVTILSTFIQVPTTVSFDTDWKKFCTEGRLAYPCEALHYQKLSGNVFTMYEWGGFVEWQKPKIKVFFDGRMPAWTDENGENPYPVFLRIIQVKEGWNEKLRKLDTNQIFIATGTFLDLELQKNAKIYHWEEVYRDNTAVIYQNTKR